MKLVSQIDTKLVKAVAEVIYDQAEFIHHPDINKDDFVELVSNSIFDMDTLPQWRVVNSDRYELVAYGAVLATTWRPRPRWPYDFPEWRVEYTNGHIGPSWHSTLKEAQVAAETVIFKCT